jgi:hypothetical protein
MREKEVVKSVKEEIVSVENLMYNELEKGGISSRGKRSLNSFSLDCKMFV